MGWDERGLVQFDISGPNQNESRIMKKSSLPLKKRVFLGGSGMKSEITKIRQVSLRKYQKTKASESHFGQNLCM